MRYGIKKYLSNVKDNIYDIFLLNSSNEQLLLLKYFLMDIFAYGDRASDFEYAHIEVSAHNL